jgi:serine/threonine-protein kinase
MPAGTEAPPPVSQSGDDAEVVLVPEQALAADSDAGESYAALGSTRVIPFQEGDTAEPAGSGTDRPAPPRKRKKRKKTNELGDFRLLQKLGEGAMGVVYRAHQVSMDRAVAVKVLFKHIAANPKLVERFYREARVTGSLDHPNIVQGYGVGEAQGWHYFAMEYIDGQSLQQWLTELGRLTVPDAVHIILRCARALQYAHAHGVIHRDVKPDNILITRQGVVKVADLGMVKRMDEDMALTQTGHAVGTPWYMPLEQARNAKETDGRCDIYALGCVFYALLTGEPPFAGKTIVEVIEAKERGTFPPARRGNLEVPEQLDLIIAKMAAKQPRYRYQDCTEVIRDLEKLKLASARLGFLQPRSPAETQVGSPTPDETLPTPLPDRDDAGAADVWYTRYRTPAGQAVVRRLTTAQVLNLIDQEHFDPTTQASRSPKEGYRSLATYREFAAQVLGRVAKSGADQQTARYRSLYQKIEKQEREREEAEQQKKNASNTRYWLGIALRLGGVGLGVVLLYLLVRLVIQELSGVFW